MLQRLTILITALIFGLFMFTACDDDTSVDPTPPEEEANIAETAEEDGNFTILLDLAEEAGIADVLANDELTVFAPTDDAFNNLPDGVLDGLDAAQLIQILEFHLVEGTVASGDIAEQQDTESVQGELLLLQNDGSDVVVNGSANVINANIEASNGMIHAIDEVLLPSQIRLALEQPNFIDVALASEGDFDILLGALEQAGLITTLQFLGPFTGFAPSDEAFQEIDTDELDGEQLLDVLLYHVTEEGVFESGDLEASQRVVMMNGDELLITAGEDGVFLNEIAQVVLPDNPATNGVIHVIDQVLMPESLGGGAPAE